MPPRLRRLGITLLVSAGLLAPTAAAVAEPTTPHGSSIRIERRAATDEVRTATDDEIVVRDLADACPQGELTPAGFTDVARGSTFSQAIDCLVGYGITVGRTATTYDPTAPVTRAQMAVFIHRLLDDAMVLPTAPERSRFRDVAATGEVGRAINVLASDELAAILGVRVVAGQTADTYAPGGTVTRAQMASFIARTFEGLLEVKGFEITDRGICRGVFTDERRIPAAHAGNVELLCASGIVTGRTDGTYGPSAAVTRGQMAAFLMRTKDIVVEAGLLRPAHLRTELFVDRGTGAEPCDDAGRDGSSGSPFCTVQAAVDTAAELDDHQVRVWVRWRTGQPAYDEWLRVDAGDAAVLEVVGHAAVGARVPFVDAIDVEGSADTYTTLGRIELTGDHGVDSHSAGYTAFSDVGTDTTYGVYVEQPTTGDTYIFGSELGAEEAAIAVASTGLVESRGTRFVGTPPAYVEVYAADAPADEMARLFRDYFTDPALGNRFERTPVVGEVKGMPALIPSS